MPIPSGNYSQQDGIPGGRSRSSGSGGGTPDQIAAGITRDQWQHFLDTYKPVEDDILATALSTDFSAQGDEAGATAGRSIAASAGAAERNISRSGASLTGEERAAISRRRGLSKSKAVGRAENTTRRGLADSRTNLIAQLVGIGRGVAQTASAGSQSVADMAAARDSLWQSQKSQTKANNLSTAASAAALIISVV